MELNNEIFIKIVDLSSEGDSLVNEGKFGEAVNRYNEALKLLPDSIYDWDAATWLYTALGDVYYMKKEYQDAINNLIEARKCPGGIENPFIILRLGESYFELGYLEKAKEFLLQAYMIEGTDIFNEEPEKYYDIIKSIE